MRETLRTERNERGGGNEGEKKRDAQRLRSRIP